MIFSTVALAALLLLLAALMAVAFLLDGFSGGYTAVAGALLGYGIARTMEDEA